MAANTPAADANAPTARQLDLRGNSTKQRRFAAHPNSNATAAVLAAGPQGNSTTPGPFVATPNAAAAVPATGAQGHLSDVQPAGQELAGGGTEGMSSAGAASTVPRDTAPAKNTATATTSLIPSAISQSTVQEVKLLQVRCSSEHRAAPSAHPAVDTPAVDDAAANGLAPPSSTAMMPAAQPKPQHRHLLTRILPHVPFLGRTMHQNMPQKSIKHYPEPPCEFTMGYTPAEVRSATSMLADELHRLVFTLPHDNPEAAQALFLAASCGLPAELQQLVLQGDKGLQQDIVKHHVWKTLQATVWNQDLCTSSWLAQMLNAQGLTHAAGPPASSDFQALCAAWCSGQLCPTFSHLVEAVAAAVLSRLMPATSTAAASFRQLLLPLVQAAMRWQVVVLACHAGLRIVVDGWDSCRSSSGSLQQLVQGLKPLDRELHSAAGAPVSVTIEHTAESQQIQLVLLCTKPGVVWASHQGGAPAQPIGAVQEVKLLQVRCSSEHLAAPSAHPAVDTPAVHDAAANGLAPPSSTAMMPAAQAGQMSRLHTRTRAHSKQRNQHQPDSKTPSPRRKSGPRK